MKHCVSCLIYYIARLSRKKVFWGELKGGIGKKTVEETISDASRTNLFKLGVFGVVLQRQFTNQFFHARYELTKATRFSNILVPRGGAPFGQHQDSLPLGWSPRFTDFPSNLID